MTRTKQQKHQELIELLIRWNEATAPYKLRTDAEHTECVNEARAVMARIRQLGFCEGRDYCELSNGSLHPVPTH